MAPQQADAGKVDGTLAALRRCLFLTALPLVYISFALPLEAKRMGASAVEIGGLYSIFTISLVLVRPLVGVGLDRFGRRPFLLTALLAYGCANAIYVVTVNVEGMYVARFLQGLAASLLLITAATITTDRSVASGRARAIGINVERQARGMIAGAVVGFTLVAATPALAWRISFSVYALCALAALLYASGSVHESRPRHAGPGVPGISVALPRALRGLIAVIFVIGFANAMVQPIYLIYLSDRFNVGMLVLAWAFLPAGIVYATLPSRLGHLSDRFGRANTLAAGLSIAGCLYLLLPQLPGLLLIAVVYTAGHVGWAMAEPARTAWIGDLSGRDDVGRTFGVGEFFLSVGATIGPLAGGWIYDQMGRELAFYLNGAILLATACAVLMLRANEPARGSGASDG